MWAHLQREGIPVARSTVERLMRAHGWQGVRRQTKVRTTVVDPAAARAPDLVDRQVAVPAPNRLLVADFTYVRLACGVFVYVAFVIEPTPARSSAGRSRDRSRLDSWSARSARPSRCDPGRGTPLRAQSTTPTPAPRADSTGRRNTGSVA
jgi:hypothetical protein